MKRFFMSTGQRLLSLLGFVLLITVTAVSAVQAQPVHLDGLPYNVFRPGLSGDGEWIVWHLGDLTDLHLKNLDSGDITTIDLASTLGIVDLEFPNEVYPRLNNDGTVIALFSDSLDGSGSGRAARTLFVIDAGGNELARMTATDYYGDVARFQEELYIDDAGRYVLVTAQDYIRTLYSVTPGGNATLEVSGDISNVYRLDIQTGAINMVSVDENGNEPNDNSTARGLSADGRFALFETYATDMPGNNGNLQVYRRDMTLAGSSAVVQVSKDGTGDTVGAASVCEYSCMGNVMSNDGNRVVFYGFDDNESRWIPWLWELGVGSSELVELSAQEQLEIAGTGDWLSAEGEVFFRWNYDTQQSDATDLNIRDPMLSDDGSLLLFKDENLARPPGEDGPWWMIRFDAPPDDDITPPYWPEPASLVVIMSNGDAELEWSFATDDTAVTEYFIIRDDIEIGRVDFTINSFRDPAVPPGTYTYTIQAGDAAGNTSMDGPTAQLTVNFPLITIEVSETITVQDMVKVLPAIIIDVSESVSVNDNVVTLPSLTILVQEAITITDEPTVSVSAPVSDIITIFLPQGGLFPGSVFTASAEGFKPLSQVQAFLQSEPVLVGEETADEDGEVFFTITVPLDFPPGPHTLIMIGEDGDGEIRRLTADILVYDPDAVYGEAYPIPGPTIGHWSLWLLILSIILTAARVTRRF